MFAKIILVCSLDAVSFLLPPSPPPAPFKLYCQPAFFYEYYLISISQAILGEFT